MKRALIIVLLAVLVIGCGASKQAQQSQSGSVKTVSVEEFSKVISKKNVRLIDVRTPKEYADGHLKKAENIDVRAFDFTERTKKVKGQVAVYCFKGVRSLKAANQLAAQGCTVYNLEGGINAWKQAGKPVTQ